MNARHFRSATALLILATCAVALTASADSARADGFIVSRQPVEVAVTVPPDMQRRLPFTPLGVRYHRVESDISGGVAVTRIDQVFVNHSSSRIEGDYIFPLDDDIALTSFNMYINGKEVKGELLDADAARAEYESIVRRMKDPALLEYVGAKMFRARVFPIEPNGEARIKLEYAQQLTFDAGLTCYRYPLNTEKFSATPLDQVSVAVRIHHDTPIKSVFCTSHDVAVHREGDHRASVSYEAQNVRPDTDFVLYYSVAADLIGFTMLTHRLPGEDGYFLARVAPPSETDPERIVPKDVCFVVDTSGSMSGPKIEQARRALEFCVNSLGPRDRFSVIPFSHEPQPWKPSLVPAEGQNLADARAFIIKLRANGGTNIHDALLTALNARPTNDDGRPYMIVFLTDGQPTVGITDEDEILQRVGAANGGAVRLFVFGIGNDVNTRLLDVLAEKNHGARDYIGNTEDIEVKVSAFFSKVAQPVLSGLKLAWDGLDVYDVFPKQLPDLFAGGEIVVLGRYRGGSQHAIKLAGRRAGETLTFNYSRDFPKLDERHDFLPRLWAIRKVGYLLDLIRQNGENEELKSSVVELALEYGIITPYTSYLVKEQSQLASVAPGTDLRRAMHDVMQQEIAAGRELKDDFAEKMQATSGRAAVQQSAQNNTMRNADRDAGFGNAVAAAPNEEEAHETQVQLVRNVGRRAFVLNRRTAAADQWVQSDIQLNMKRRNVAQYSAEYFRLANSSAEIARILAAADLPVFEHNGEIIEIVPPEEG